MMLLTGAIPTLFLSTLSLRRATRSHRRDDGGPIHFYPRSPCGERHQRHWLDKTHRRISIHALLAESDLLFHAACFHAAYFYPRSPCGERLFGFTLHVFTLHISIHALLAESDLDRWLAGLKGTLFLSTLSLRRATLCLMLWPFRPI